jgi:hypothetical protein
MSDLKKPEAVTTGHIQGLRRLREVALGLRLTAGEIERLDRTIWAAQQFFLLQAEFPRSVAN